MPFPSQVALPFPFSVVCDLLESLEEQARSKSFTSDLKQETVSKWFTRNHRRIHHHSTDLSAFFSTLLPEKRTDRVYGIQAPSLHKIIGRTFCLGVSRIASLRRYEVPGSGEDLGDCVSRILTETPNPVSCREPPVTIVEIDAILGGLAASCRFSSPAVRSASATSQKIDRDDLGRLYLRLGAQEAKWFTRLVLKTFEPVALDPSLVYRCYDARLPAILLVQEDFDVALESLRTIRAANPLGLGHVMQQVKPVLGTKVGRQTWLKGRSIKHCIDMGQRRVSCEKKLDGEYCQIHIDLSRGPAKCIQIFSKSGKDSTADRAALHRAIKESLRIGQPNCKISKGCILEGELLVYNDRQGKIMPFHKIRKYVSRSGVHLGVDQDSPPDPDEHLMIVYFDVLLIDDESLLGNRQTERFTRLSNLINCRFGHAELVDMQIIDLDQNLGPFHLRKAFAKCIASREEGLVLKPDAPYFVFGDSPGTTARYPIKLKKEYIGNFGDVGDFAVVGARFDPAKARSYRIQGLEWTHFFLGCLNNKDAVERHRAKPHFTVIDEVELNETLIQVVKSYANTASVPFQDCETLDLQLPRRFLNSQGPTVVFVTPLVFDIRCFAFDKQGSTGFWTPRFPQVSKVHFDRTYMDTVTFSELQIIAEDARNLPHSDEDSQETLHWIAQLEGADPRGVPVDAASQMTRSSIMTPSPSKSVGGQSQRSSRVSLSCSPVKLRKPLAAVPEEEATAVPALTFRVTESASDSHVEHAQDSQPSSNGNDANMKRKRKPETSMQSSKQPRLVADSSQASGANKAPPPQAREVESRSSQTREPLADININISSSASASFSQPVPPPASQRLSLQQEPEVIVVPAPAATMASQGVRPVPETDSTHNHEHRATSRDPATCQHAARKCDLRKRDILLSPCIANQLLITETLLPRHGITTWKTDVSQWVKESAQHIEPSTSVALDPPPQQQQQQQQQQPAPRRLQKTLFIEKRRPEASLAIMESIESLNLRLPNGRREWVEVYDWRFLEDLDQLEKKYAGELPKDEVRALFKSAGKGLA